MIKLKQKINPFWLARWILQKQEENFLRSLIETKAQVDEVSDRQVRFVLLQMRWKRAVDPYFYIFKLAWETIRGRYRKSGSKNNSGAYQASGGGAGAAGQPVAQFTGYGAGFAGAYAFPTTATASVAADFEDAGILAGEVIAYRCWILQPDGFLYSVYRHDFRWPPGEVVEGNAAGGDGVHAFKSLILMAKYADTPESFVTGTVDLWGEVYEHERGYRASKAAIRSIDDSPYYDAEALRKLYGLTKLGS